MTTCRPTLFVCTAVLLGLCAPALAQSGDATPAPAALFEKPAPTPRNWAVTMSPVHLVLPVIEFAVERRLASNLGVALMFGGGSVTDDLDNKFTVGELGVSVRYYGLGDFAKGLQVGAALEYLTVSGEDVNGSSVDVEGDGVVVAPFIGYKHTWGFGLTFDGQLGPAFTAIEAEADNGATEEESRVGAYLNLNLGWSF